MIRNFLKTAWRNLVRQKVFSFINIAGLAMSLTAVCLIALFIADELSFDKYHENADRVYRLASHGGWGEEKFDVTGTSGQLAEAVKRNFPQIEETVRMDAEGGGILEYEGKKIKDDAIFFTDPSFFTLFTHKFLAGSAYALDKPNTVVLTRTLALKFFSDPATALNKTITIDNNPLTVTGIIEDVPTNSHFSFHAVRRFSPDYMDDWNSLSIYTYVLLKQNASPVALQSKLSEFVKNSLQGGLKTINYSLELQPLTSIHLHSHLKYELAENGDVKYLYVLSIVGILIFIIAFINYTNITTARASFRLREVAVRKIVGSSRKSLVGLFISESVITILLATGVAIALLVLVMPLFNYVTGKQLSTWQFGLTRSLLCLLIFSTVAGTIGGWYPAFFLSRFKTIPALKNQMGDVQTQGFLRKSLVLFQFVVTVIMITTSLVIYLQLKYVSNTDLGFNKNQVFTFHIDSREAREKVEPLRAALMANPVVEGVAAAGNPIGNNNIGMREYFVEKNGLLDEHSKLAYGLTIDPNFIPAMQIKVLEGRNFSPAIQSDSSDVIVNESFVKNQGWTSGIGKRISRGRDSTGDAHFASIVGVVKDFHIYSLQHLIEPMILELPEQARDQDNLYVRIGGQNLAQALTYVDQTFRRFDAGAFFDPYFLDQNFVAQYRAEEKQGEVLLAFTILTIIIACLGLFGLVTFTVEKKVREIGIRKVLGASVSGIVSMLTESLIKVVLIALLVAVPLSWLISSKWLEDFAYRIQLNWWIFALAGVVSLIIAFATLSLQAVKAALANPVKSLRAE